MTEQEAIRLLRIAQYRPSMRAIARAANVDRAYLRKHMAAGRLPKCYLERLEPVLIRLGEEFRYQNACSTEDRNRA